MLRYTLLALALSACYQAPAAENNSVELMLEPAEQTIVDPGPSETPSGCGPSNDTVDQLINREYVKTYVGYDKDNKGLVVFERTGDKTMVIVDFRDDQTSCVREVIYNVRMIQDE